MTPPRILVVPGLDGHPGLLQWVERDLFDGFRPIYFDHQQDRADGGIDGLAERANRLLDDGPRASEPAFVCGESFGGPVAIALAHRYPARFAGLVLFSTFSYYAGPARLGASVGLSAWKIAGNRVAYPLLRVARPLGTASQLGFKPTWQTVAAYLHHPLPDVDAYREKCRLSATLDLRARLPEIQVPTLIVTGTFDPVVPPAAGRAMQQSIPRARRYVLDGGHIVHVVRPKDTNALLRRWAEQETGIAALTPAGSA